MPKKYGLFLFLAVALIFIAGCVEELPEEAVKEAVIEEVESAEKLPPPEPSATFPEIVENKAARVDTPSNQPVKLIVSNPLDLSQIEKISKFRSCVGHDYSGLNSKGEKETLRSMKHYVQPLPELIGSDKVKVYAPFAGVVSEVQDSFPGKQVFISSSTDRSWNFIFFHIVPTAEIKHGAEVKAGQLIGSGSPDSPANFDIGLKKFGFAGQIFDSPFAQMSDSVLEEYRSQGITSENIILSKEERDRAPCPVEGTRNGDALFPGSRQDDFVSLLSVSLSSPPPVRQQIESFPQSNSHSEYAFYQDGQVIFEHYWPLDPASNHLKADESEILVYNDGTVPVQIISPDMIFFLDGKSYPQYSGTWERFPSRTSWERIEYINIDPEHYHNEPLILQPGQKGKIHYHYKFDTDISTKKHSVHILITSKVNGIEKKIDQTLVRTRALLPSVPTTEAGNQGESSSGGH